MTRNAEVLGQFVGDTHSAEIPEYFKDLFPEHSDLSLEEILQLQEMFYQSIKGNEYDRDSPSYNGQSSDLSWFSGQEGDSSWGQRGKNVESQLALDEALARSLELGDEFDNLSIADMVENVPGDTVISSGGTPVSPGGTPISSHETPVRSLSPDMSQDDVNPDDMTYEQLQSLGDSVGAESKGLSEEVISILPSRKTGLFTRKKKDDCVICCIKFKSGVYLTTLPCSHDYHSDCIAKWLKINKCCPICKEEVRG